MSWVSLFIEELDRKYSPQNMGLIHEIKIKRPGNFDLPFKFTCIWCKSDWSRKAGATEANRDLYNNLKTSECACGRVIWDD